MGYDLRYENAEGRFLFILRHMPNGSKQVRNEQGRLPSSGLRIDRFVLRSQQLLTLIIVIQLELPYNIADSEGGDAGLSGSRYIARDHGHSSFEGRLWPSPNESILAIFT